MFNFTNRAEYLEYRRQWKANYKELSQNIRSMKERMKDEAKKGNEDAAAICQREREILRKQARRALEQLAEAKVEAQRQYMASKASV